MQVASIEADGSIVPAGAHIILMRAFNDRKRTTKTLQAFQNYRRRGFRPSVSAFEAAMTALGRMKRYDEMFDLLDEMCEFSAPSSLTYAQVRACISWTLPRVPPGRNVAHYRGVAHLQQGCRKEYSLGRCRRRFESCPCHIGMTSRAGAELCH